MKNLKICQNVFENLGKIIVFAKVLLIDAVLSMPLSAVLAHGPPQLGVKSPQLGFSMHSWEPNKCARGTPAA